MPVTRYIPIIITPGGEAIEPYPWENDHPEPRETDNGCDGKGLIIEGWG